MAETSSLDPQLYVGKERIRKDIRNALTYKNQTPPMMPDMTCPLFEPIHDTFRTFIENFRAAGGKYIPCNTQNFVQYLIKIAQGQQYNMLLNTSPNLGAYLDKHKVHHVNAINLNEPVDAALFFSNVLVARTGAIGFTQQVDLYASVKNLAKDIIVVSRERCIFPDYEDALAYLREHNGNTTCPITEFVVPTRPEEINGKPQYTPREPRIILMLVEEPRPESHPIPEPQPENAPSDEPQD
jgi:Uncharacterized conserved protein